MNDKNTGLGSLLLRRTDPDDSENKKGAQQPERSQRPDVSTVPPTPTPNRQPKPLRDRCTIYLDPEVNRRLDLVARVEQKERSQVVTELLRKALPRYRIDLE